MMKYQLTRFGEGFIERPQMSLSVALEKLRTKLRRIDGPYEINDGPKIARDEVIRRLKVQFSNSKDQPLRFVINGDSYDQPMWVIRSVIAVVPEDPLITWGKRYLGASPYVFGTAGPPGPSDCSGFTQSAVQAVHGITLPHSAALQRQDDRFWIFQWDQLQDRVKRDAHTSFFGCTALKICCTLYIRCGESNGNNRWFVFDGFFRGEVE